MTRIAMAVLCPFLLGPVAGARAGDPLFTDIGGRPGLERIVGTAVAMFLADDRIKDDFDNINLDRLKGRLADEICVAINGPCQYKGRPMAAAHAGLDINRAKFNAVAEDLQAAMAQEGVGYWTQNRVLARLAPMQRDIVNR